MEITWTLLDWSDMHRKCSVSWVHFCVFMCVMIVSTPSKFILFWNRNKVQSFAGRTIISLFLLFIIMNECYFFAQCFCVECCPGNAIQCYQKCYTNSSNIQTRRDDTSILLMSPLQTKETNTEKHQKLCLTWHSSIIIMDTCNYVLVVNYLRPAERWPDRNRN